MEKLITKNALFGYFPTDIWNDVLKCEMSALKSVWLQIFVQKSKFSNLEPKMSYLSDFGSNFEKLLLYFNLSFTNLSHGKV